MNESGNPFFYPFQKINITLFIWYMTLNGNEITLYSNGNYLGVNLQLRIATKEQFMQRFNGDATKYLDNYVNCLVFSKQSLT